MKFLAWFVVFIIVFSILESLGGNDDVNALVACLAGIGAALLVALYQKQHNNN